MIMNESIMIPDSVVTAEITKREEEVLQLICRGMSMQEIGKQLYVSESTIITHKKNLFKKFGVNKVVLLAVLAIKHRYFSF